MSIFNYFQKKTVPNDEVSNDREISYPEIKESEFIDNSDPIEYQSYSQEVDKQTYGFLPINDLYRFLNEDYEKKAYQDALTNPDTSYKEKNIQIIKSRLEINFKMVTLKYEDLLREIDFHIETRSRAGLSDIVEELKSKKQTYLRHVDEINKMKADLERKELYMCGVFSSYEIGFTRGLASISLHTINKRYE